MADMEKFYNDLIIINLYYWAEKNQKHLFEVLLFSYQP